MPQEIIGNSREQVFGFFDDYAYQRKEEIDRHKLGKDTGLLKSYVLETSRHNGTLDVEAALAATPWQLKRVGADDFFSLENAEEILGYVEPLSNRYLAVHSFRPNDPVDRAVQRTIRETSDLDSLWLAGDAFKHLWESFVLPTMPKRFVSMKFQYEERFEATSVEDHWDNENDMEEKQTEADDSFQAERRAASFSFVERTDNLAKLLPKLQNIYPAFRAIRMLRIPGSERGGYDLYNWGKLTYRAPSFRNGRQLLIYITKLYEEITQSIEEQIWLSVESTHIHEQSIFTLRGAPVIFRFLSPLSLPVFHHFIDVTFSRGQGPFRLWGNPICLSEQKVHVYGMDLHLWQRVYMEFTPRQFVFILPEGTCGNTVHRLMTNIQRYLAPDVHLKIGDREYNQFFEDALTGQGDFND